MDVHLPQQPCPAAQFQDILILPKLQPLIDPFHPPLGAGAVVMEPDALLQVARCPVLLLYLLFLCEQVQQPDQEAQFVALPAVLHHLHGGEDFFQLALFLQQKLLLLRQLLLHAPGGHDLLDFLEGETQVLQRQDALEHGQGVLIVVPVSRLRMGNGLQQAFCVIKAYGAQGYPGDSGDFTRGV